MSPIPANIRSFVPGCAAISRRIVLACALNESAYLGRATRRPCLCTSIFRRAAAPLFPGRIVQ